MRTINEFRKDGPRYMEALRCRPPSVHKDLALLVLTGSSYKEAAVATQTSANTVREKVSRELRRAERDAEAIERKDDPTAPLKLFAEKGLNARIVHALHCMEIKTVGQLRDFLDDGLSSRLLLEARYNLGRKSVLKIYEFTGIEYPLSEGQKRGVAKVSIVRQWRMGTLTAEQAMEKLAEMVGQ